MLSKITKMFGLGTPAKRGRETSDQQHLFAPTAVDALTPGASPSSAREPSAVVAASRRSVFTGTGGAPTVPIVAAAAAAAIDSHDGSGTAPPVKRARYGPHSSPRMMSTLDPFQCHAVSDCTLPTQPSKRRCPLSPVPSSMNCSPWRTPMTAPLCVDLMWSPPRCPRPPFTMYQTCPPVYRCRTTDLRSGQAAR